MALSRETRARRYLQASMAAGYTGLPGESREAYEAQMRSHERAYPRVREHALAGTDQDFDAPLQPGEREHQQHLRGAAGMQGSDAQRIRKEMRDSRPKKTPPPPGRRRSSSPRSPSRGARAAAGAGASAVGAATGGRGNLFMQLVGWTLVLSLIYLLVAGKGAAALGGIVGTIVGGVRTFVAPVDPIRSLEGALGATPATSTPALTGTVASGAPGSAPVGSSSVRLTPTGQLHGGATAPAPSSIRLPKKVTSWGLPPSLLRADLNLRRQNAVDVAAGRETVKQAHTREEALIPRAKYPAFYANQ